MTSRPLLAISFIVFVDVLAFTLVLPYLPFYAEHFGASPSEVGLLITVFAFCQFLAGPVLGRLSDQMGRKPVLILSQIGTFAGFIILSLSTHLWMVYLARIIDGITAGNITVAQAAMSDVTQPHERAKAFSLIGVAFGLGFFIGPAIAGLLTHYGYQAPAWGAAFFSFCSILCTTFLFKDADHIKQGSQPFRIRRQDLGSAFNLRPLIKYLKLPKLRPYMIQLFFFNLSFSSQISGFAMFAERKLLWNGVPFGAKEVGYVYAYLGFLGIGIRSALIARMTSRFGEKITSRIGFISQGLGYASYAFVTNVPTLLIAATVGSLGSGLVRPALSALMSKEVSEREQGVVFGVSQSLASLAAIAAPLIAGALLQHSAPENWALFSGISMLIALLF